ncbi:MAG: penicillin-binding transpeptidase domain-containing protein [Steroidobacteraceae bacterium]
MRDDRAHPCSGHTAQRLGVHGKTGTGYQMQANGPDLKRQVGWFVGWASRGGRTIVFAYAITDEQPDGSSAGRRARTACMAELPRLLDAESAAH